MMGIPLGHILILGAILFTVGLVGALTRRNILIILMCVELMLNASNINFVAFSRYVEHAVDGQIMAAFVIVLAAAEAAVALAIVLAMYRNFGTANADVVQSLKR